MRTGRPPKSIEERFSTKYLIRRNGCWEWRSAADLTGYGFIKRKDGVQLRAHRVSWEICKGAIPEGLFVLHKCDNHRCVNPDHLFLGTHQDNMDDMVEKQRLPKHYGEENGKVKLTEKEVLAILKDSRSQSKIGQDYGISQTNVGMIKSGKRWGHFTGRNRNK